MNVALVRSEAMTEAPRDIFASARGRLPGAGKVAEKRQQAFDAYASAGLPHRRIEDWKYTDLRVLMREVLPLASAPDATALKRASAALKLHTIAGVRRLVPRRRQMLMPRSRKCGEAASPGSPLVRSSAFR